MRVLNVGGGTVAIRPEYLEHEVVLLDIDPAVRPDIIMDARNLGKLPEGEFDVVYASHILEHVYEHEIDAVLKGFLHVLSEDGYADIRVPDAREVLEVVIRNGLDLDSELYASAVGPIRVCDVLWGWQQEIKESGHDYYGHRIGFSRSVLGRALQAAGFGYVLIGTEHFELRALAYKHRPKESENDK